MNGELQPGLYLNQEHQFIQEAEMNPLQVVTQGTEMLRHLDGFEAHYVNIRDNLLLTYPQQKTHFEVFWGRTGVGKRQTISQFIHLVELDPVLNESLAELGVTLKIVYLPFSHAVNLARLRGEMDPTKQRGLFTEEEYRRASTILTGYTMRELNNFEGPTLAIVEPSGPTAFVNPDQTLEGWDRGFSTVYLLSKYCRDITRVLVIQRGAGLADKILTFRKALPEASPEEIADVIIGAHLKVARKGQPADIRKWSRSALIGLKQELISSMASSEGVIRSNEQMDKLMLEKYGTQGEEDFWPVLLERDLGWSRTDYAIVENPVTETDFTLHTDLLRRYNPMQEEIKTREKLLKRG